MPGDSVDQMIEAYVSWREACLKVDETYVAWIGTAPRRASDAFSEYLAALDHEEQAAAYAGSIQRLAELTAG